MKIRSLALFIAIIIPGLFFQGCRESMKPQESPDKRFMEYITAYTGGVISSVSTIQVRLSSVVIDNLKPDPEEDLARLFRISPAVKGNAFLSENSTVIFTPDESLQAGEKYTVSFDLGSLTRVPKELRNFRFSFDVIPQSFSVEVDGIASEYEDFSLVAVKGNVILADVATAADIEKLLTASSGRKDHSITWNHNSDEHYSSFTIDSIARQEEDMDLKIAWNGKSLGINDKGETQVRIPSKNTFRFIQARVVHQPEQYVSLLFSDPLSSDQTLMGLLDIRGLENIRITTNRNEVLLYPAEILQGKRTVHIDGSLRSQFGKTLGNDREIELSFDALYPAVKFLSSGSILPQSDHLVIPFQAVNLKAVRVRVIRIYEDNVIQFLQENEINGNYELKRVGRPIFSRQIPLKSDKPVDLGQWNTFFLDIGELIKVEPGAIYNILISFTQDNSLYACESLYGPEKPADEAIQPEPGDDDFSEWDDPGYYYDEFWPDDFNWSERDDPCKPSYFNGNRFISKNILASNLGVIAKTGSNGLYTVCVTDLLSTGPVGGADIVFYNFQQQEIARGKTGSDGMAEIRSENKPFILIASSGNQKGYLKLNDGAALSLSKFDVEGEAVKDNLKGFIYGERGVWRPGDSIFLMFLLQDESRTLPANHPVKFELLNPEGKVVRSVVRNADLRGFYGFNTDTDEDAKTGIYTARVTVGNAQFTRNVRIESVKPNRLKIGLDFGTTTLRASQSPVRGTLSARWLHGGIAKGMKGTVEVAYKEGTTTFPGYKNFTFKDPSKYFFSEDKLIFDQKLTDQGSGTVQVTTEGNLHAPGMLTASFQVKVFEPSGEFSIDRFSMPFAPYDRFVGLRVEGMDKYGFLQADSSFLCNLAAVNWDGTPASAGELTVSVYRSSGQWWWNSDEDNQASYFSGNYLAPLKTEQVKLINGKGNFKLSTRNMKWGLYYIRVTDQRGGHSAGKAFYIREKWWYWDEENDQARQFATMLEFTTDKEKYVAGDRATVFFPAGKSGKAWITIENGSEILSSQKINIDKSEMEYTFQVTPEMAPNAYIAITLLQPHSQTVNDLPIRLYGVIPVMVEDPASKLEPVVKAPAEIRPEKEFSIKVKEARGKSMAYTLAVVDEGLLDLTRFKTPDPWNYFYAREALGVKTWDMFDQVIGAYGGQIERVLAIGGDEYAPPDDSKKLSRFKPVVTFLGPFELKAGEEKSHTLKITNYIGSVRVMAVAANGDGAFGSAEATVPVKQPLMVLATLPRMLGPEENVKLPVTVFMMDDKQADVTVRIETNDLLSISGAVEKTVRFSAAGEQVIDFDLEVKPGVGWGKVAVTATAGSEKVSHEVNIEIRNPNPPIRLTYFQKIEPGKTWEQPLTVPGMAGTNELYLEVAGTLPLDLTWHLSYLVAYPYGCAEQITSKAFPQLYLANLCELTPEQTALVQQNVKEVINELSKFQGTHGGFGFWQNYVYPDDYLSSYVGHFLLEAKGKGFTVSNAMKKSWIRYQKNAAGGWSYRNHNDDIQAYRLYTLALAGEPLLGAMNRLRGQAGLSPAALAHLASAYVLAGQKEAAKEVWQRIASAKPDDQRRSYYYRSELYDLSLNLEVLLYLGMDDEAQQLAVEVSRRFGQNVYHNTHTTSYILYVLSKYSGGKKTGKSLKYAYQLGNQPEQAVVTTFPFHYKMWHNTDAGFGPVRIVNQGNQDIFARISEKGIPIKDAAPAAERNLKLNIRYEDLDGNPFDITTLNQGKDFRMKVIVTHPGMSASIENLALSTIFPSGWEIINRQSTIDNPFDYQDVRDDRCYTFFGLAQGESKEFVFYLNATYQGRFYHPSVFCEAMYDENVFSRVPGRWVTVVP